MACSAVVRVADALKHLILGNPNLRISTVLNQWFTTAGGSGFLGRLPTLIGHYYSGAGTPVLFSDAIAVSKLSLEQPVNPTPEQVAFRAKLWRNFVAGYQVVLITAPENFSDYCTKFRERWIAGK